MKLSVNPIYGWGWFMADGRSLDVPPPFVLEAESLDAHGTEFVGHLQLEGHALNNLWLLLTFRGDPDNYNLRAFPERPQSTEEPETYFKGAALTGFASAKRGA